jgi:hypothetical protein
MRNKATLVAVVAALALAGGAMAAARDGAQSSANALTGSWLVSVNRGPTLPPLSSLQSFSQGGAVIEAANTVGNRGPSHGSWTHVRNRLYASTIVFFRFNAQGAFDGTQKIRRTLRLSNDGNRFTAVSISELRDAAGTVIAENLRATETAERIAVERIPDVP